MNGPRGGERGDELERDLAVLGLRLEREEEDRAPESFAVWPENWDALELFLACDTQWRVVQGMGASRVLGFDYQGVEIVMRHVGTKRAERTKRFAQLQVMERAAANAMNARRDG